MVHFGIITPPVLGHLHPFGALGSELQARGHRVTVIHMPDLQSSVESEGLDFVPVGASDFPVGSLARTLESIGRQKGWAALRYAIGAIDRTTNMLCRDAPAAIQSARIDALLVDQTEPAGAAIARHLELPFITICNALVMNREWHVPPPSFGWAYHETIFAGFRNAVGYQVWDFMTRRILQTIGGYQRDWGNRPFESMEESFSSLLQISQQAPAFDFPRKKLPSHFHYVGPLRRSKLKAVGFPWDRLDGRPLIYASLGTQQGSKIDIFKMIAEACQELPVQLVISHAYSLREDQITGLAGHPIVVAYAPQDELLQRAQLAITHAGLNTVLDSLSHTIPLVALPVTYEQPAIAARIQWTGTGQTLSLAKASPAKLRETIRKVLQDPSFRQKAARVAESIRQSGGVGRAADLIENAVHLTQEAS